MGSRDSDVVVIGAGISGLAAARRLLQRGIAQVVVVDARTEPGGKCLRRPVDGRPLDCGAGWTGPGQSHIKELASSVGVDTYRVEVEGGRLVRLAGGEATYADPDDAGMGREAAAELERARAELERLCKTVPPDRPWEADGAEELDSLTVESWIRGQTTDTEVQIALAHIFEETTASPRQLSLLSAVAFIASCGGVEGLESGADELFDGGAGLITRRIANELGDRLQLGWVVSEISWSDEGVVIVGSRETLGARHVIVAMSPADVARIQFRPLLPTIRQLLHKGWLPSSLIKTNVVYETPFWHTADRDRPPIAGWAVNESGCPSVVLDATPVSGAFGVLVAFTALLGEHERFAVGHDVLDDPQTRTDVMLRNLARMFGPPAERPLAVQETHWGAEPYVDSCLGFAPPGLLTQCGEALRDPVGPIHWAGAETANVWINHLNGGVQAGERAADEVIDALGSPG